MIVHYNDFDLYFDTVFDTSLFDIDSSLPAIYDEASFTSNIERSSVAVTTNIQCWKGHVFFFEL